MVGEGKKIYTHNIDEGHEHTRTCGHVRTYAHKTHANEFVDFFYCRFLFSSFFLICTKFAIRFFFLYFFSKSVVIIKICEFRILQLPIFAPNSWRHRTTVSFALLQDLYVCAWHRQPWLLCEKWPSLCVRSWFARSTATSIWHQRDRGRPKCR